LHELGLFATRELDANDWSYSEGMLYTIPGRDTLLPELLSHAQVINTFGRSSQMLLGVHGLIPPDGWSDSSIAQLNAALYDTGGASFANASSLANAQRGASWLGIKHLALLGITLIPDAKVAKALTSCVEALAGNLTNTEGQSLMGLMEHIRDALGISGHSLFPMWFLLDRDNPGAKWNLVGVARE
jgi:hypothetical protein